jgi:large subunit ribosomal protein L9
MKLLLKRDIPKLGIVGDIVNVSAGYARNYLLPQDLAAEPTEANIRAVAKHRAEAEERRRLARQQLESEAERLADVEVTIAAAANEEGVLYGSVGTREIAAALQELGHEINAAQIHLPEPIRRLDNVLVDVVLVEGIQTNVKVWVVRSGAAAPDDEASEDRDDAGKEAGEDDDAGT